MAVIQIEKRSHRLINSAHPIIGVFDGLGTPEEIMIAFELESMTNDRLTGALGRIEAIPKEDWAVGENIGATIAMAAFIHGSQGRFNTDFLGAWYAALSVETAIKETIHHNTKRLRASAAGFPNRMQMRELISDLSAKLHDVTNEKDHSDLYRPNDYSVSQKFGEEIRRNKTDGIFYNSVRHSGGKNIVIFRPKILVPVIQGDHYEYSWDKEGNPEVKKITNVKL